MKRTLLFLFALCMVSEFGDQSTAQTFADASRTLEEAAHAEMVMGNITRATDLYEQVAESSSASRSDVVRALLALGNIYEMVEPSSSVDVYQRISTEFSDFAAAFHKAQDGMNRMGVTAPFVTQDYTLVMQELPPTELTRKTFDFSPDGSQVVVVAIAPDYRRDSFPNLRRELHIRAVEGSVLRPLLSDPVDFVWMNDPRFSPDGKSIAFVGSANGNRSIVIVDVATGEHKSFRGEPYSFQRAPIWAPDSQGLLLYDGNRIKHVDFNDRVLSSTPFQMELHRLEFGNVSPDGQLLLYNRMTENSEFHQDSDIWTVNLRTGETTQRTSAEGYEGWPTWNKDGSAFFFSGGTDQVRNIFRQSLQGSSLPEKLTAYENAVATHPIFVREKNALGFVLSNNSTNVMVAHGGRYNDSRPVVRGGVPELSPDGSRVFYPSAEPGREGLWSAAIDGSDEKLLVSGRISTSYGSLNLLSPDGKQLAVFQPETNETVLYVLPSDGGEKRELYRAPGLQGLVPTWSPDGSEVAFADGGDLIVVNVQDASAETIASIRRWEGWTLTWAPSGSLIAGLGYYAGDSENSVVVVDRESGDVRRLTDMNLSNYKEILDWHPDGRHLSFMYYGYEFDDEGDGSMMVSVDNEDVTHLTEVDGEMWDYIGIWGPDKAYYFSSTPPGIGNEWLLYRSQDGSGEAELVRTANGKNIGLPTWSKDGSVMAWNEWEENHQLWMLTNY